MLFSNSSWYDIRVCLSSVRILSSSKPFSCHKTQYLNMMLVRNVRMLDTLQAIISCLMSSSNSWPNNSRLVLQIPRSVVSSSSITVFSLARARDVM